MRFALNDIFFTFSYSIGHDERTVPGSLVIAYVLRAIWYLRMEITSYICMIDQWQNLIIGTARVVAMLTSLVPDLSLIVSKVFFTASPRSTLSKALCFIGGGRLSLSSFFAI